MFFVPREGCKGMDLKECQQVMVHLSHTEVLVLQVREKMLERFVYLPLIGVFKLSCSVFFFFVVSFFWMCACLGGDKEHN